MGLCTHKRYKSFFTEVESLENGLVEGGFIILKYCLDISKRRTTNKIRWAQEKPA